MAARCCSGTLSSFTGRSVWVVLRCCCCAHLWTILIYLNIIWNRKTQPDVASYWVTGYLIAIPTSPRTDIYLVTPPHLHPRGFLQQTMLSTACLLTTSPPSAPAAPVMMLLLGNWTHTGRNGKYRVWGRYGKQRVWGRQITTWPKETDPELPTKVQTRVGLG